MGFAEDIKAFQAKALAQANTSISKKVESLFNNVVELSPNSPVRKGPFSTGVVKGNWYVAVNSVNYTVGSSPDPSGASSYSRIKSTLATMPWLGKDATVAFTNSTPYIRFVEFIGWPKNYPNPSGWKWSGRSMTPYAMVSTAVVNFKAHNI